MGFTSDAWEPIVGKPSRSQGSQRQAKNLRLMAHSRHPPPGTVLGGPGGGFRRGETKFSHAWLTLKGRRIEYYSIFPNVTSNINQNCQGCTEQKSGVERHQNHISNKPDEKLNNQKLRIRSTISISRNPGIRYPGIKYQV